MLQSTPPPRTLRFLIVHPFSFQALNITSMLEAAGYHHIESVKPEQVSLSAIQQNPPDVMVVDWLSDNPSMHEICQHIRADATLLHMVIVAVCAPEQLQIRRNVFTFGISDVVYEPLSKADLLMRIEIHWQRQQMVRALQLYRQRTFQELSSARQMQYDLLPTPSQLRHYEASHRLAVDSLFRPASEIGGDLWGLIDTPSGKLGCYVVDFTGHGVGSAINSFRLHTLLYSVRHHSDKPADFLQHLNHALCEILPRGQFATCFYACFSASQEHFHYAAAGSPPPLLHQYTHTSITPLDTAGIPLGISPDACYDSHQVPFAAADRLLICSDAIHDAHSDPIATLSSIMQQHPHASLAEAVITATHPDPEQPAEDDITIISIERTPALTPPAL